MNLRPELRAVDSMSSSLSFNQKCAIRLRMYEDRPGKIATRLMTECAIAGEEQFAVDFRLFKPVDILIFARGSCLSKREKNAKTTALWSVTNDYDF